MSYIIKQYPNKAFATKSERNKFLANNAKKIMALKKTEVKHADGFGFVNPINTLAGNVVKGVRLENPSDELIVKAIINTTGLLDSHGDVHIRKIWNKSLNENKNIMHVQEHKSNQFDKIIADGEDLKAYTKDYTWKELGYDYEGKTQALEFESNVTKDNNAYMHGLYAKGKVKNHSVGMRYVKMILCINDEDYTQYYDNWEKYYPEVANKEDAEREGAFWAIKEAKIIEGSAVPLGSNHITPTQSVSNKETEAANKGTSNEPSKDTPVKQKDYKQMAKQLLNHKK